MITKEVRAELRKASEFADSSDRLDPECALQLLDALDAADARIVELETEQGELHRELARLRGQLATAREDASEMEKKAIAEGSEALALMAEVAALKASTTVVHVDESLRMAMDRENAELKARIAELEAAAQSAIFAIQPTWAQDPASSAATLGRAITAHQESLQALAKGCDYVASQTDGYDRLVADPMVALGLLVVVGTDEDGDTTYRRIHPIPFLGAFYGEASK